jgi:nucleoside-diphosphate-sugar epimerase
MRTMRSSCRDPLNMGTDHLVSIDELAHIILELSGKRGVRIRHVPGPQGVRGRNSDNSKLVATLGWQPQTTLQEGLAITYGWIREKVRGW